MSTLLEVCDYKYLESPCEMPSIDLAICKVDFERKQSLFCTQYILPLNICTTLNFGGIGHFNPLGEKNFAKYCPMKLCNWFMNINEV